MQHLDNDMDELFKKAGENYPLRTEGADWSALQARLASDPTEDTPAVAKKSDRRYLWLLLLLLIPLAMLLYPTGDKRIGQSTQQGQAADATTPPANQDSQTQATGSPAEQAPSASIPQKLLSHPSGFDHSTTHTNSNGTGENIKAQSHGEPLTTDPETGAASNNQATTTGPDAKADNPAPSRRNPRVHRSDRRIAANNGQELKGGNPSKNNDHTPLPTGAKNKEYNGKAQTNTVESRSGSHTSSPSRLAPAANNAEANHLNDTRDSASQPTTGATFTPPAKERIPADSPATVAGAPAIDSARVSLAQTKTDSAHLQKAKSANKTNNKAGSKGFYYGLVGALDVSTIKSQQVKKVGFGLGVLFGYRLAMHWSIEAGAFWDQKQYYTAGEYFDKSRTNIPATVQVHYLDGTCDMFEFPLALRYDLPVKKNSFFATLGLTSYVMKKESYSYGAENNGAYYKGFRSYKNSGSSLFSNMQLSAGYNYHLSRTLSMRIEPYIKLPVKDIGIGKMPISSKGINIGIMHNIR